MLTIRELSNYNRWVDLSPVEIRDSVIHVGGWHKIFPAPVVRSSIVGTSYAINFGKFPQWASKVRNFFNVTPNYLKLLPSAEGALRATQIKGLRNTILPGAHDFALSGDV